MNELLRLNEEDLASELLRVQGNDPFVYAVASLARQEGWSEVRTLRVQVIVLASAYRKLERNAEQLFRNQTSPILRVQTKEPTE